MLSPFWDLRQEIQFDLKGEAQWHLFDNMLIPFFFITVVLFLPLYFLSAFCLIVSAYKLDSSHISARRTIDRYLSYVLSNEVSERIYVKYTHSALMNCSNSTFIIYQELQLVLRGKSSSTPTFILGANTPSLNLLSSTATSTKNTAHTGRWSENLDSPRTYESSMIPSPCHSMRSHLMKHLTHQSKSVHPEEGHEWRRKGHITAQKKINEQMVSFSGYPVNIWPLPTPF